MTQKIFEETELVLNNSHLSDIESGRIMPRIETLNIIIQALDIEYEDIRESYLMRIDDKKTLVELASKHIQEGDYFFAKRIVAKLIRQIKNEYGGTKQIYRLTYKVYVLLCIHYRENLPKRDKMIDYIVNI